jgi:hypothetical protein
MLTQRPKNYRSSAMTLLEIFIVIAILVILGSLLLPSLARAKAKALAIQARYALGKPTSARVFQPDWLSDEMSMEEAYQQVRKCVLDAGFGTFGFFEIDESLPDKGPGGFLLITPAERINSNGEPAPNRFDIERKIKPASSLGDWFVQFVKAQSEGEYRIFVIAVSALPSVTGSNKDTWDVLINAPSTGGEFKTVPGDLGNQKVNGARVHIHSYRFLRGRLAVNPTQVSEANSPINDEIRKAHLGAILGK